MNLSGVYKRIKANNEGADRVRRRHISRIEKMVAAVETRFPEIKAPNQIRQKHCQWLLEQWCTPSTKIDYTSSLRLLLETLNRDQNWLKQLGFPPASAGGRPRKVSVVKTRSSRFW